MTDTDIVERLRSVKTYAVDITGLKREAADEIDRLRALLMEVAESLGIRYLYWDGAHNAFINQTNVAVKYFADAWMAKHWCADNNKKWDTESLPQTGNGIEDEIKLLRDLLKQSHHCMDGCSDCSTTEFFDKLDDYICAPK